MKQHLPTHYYLITFADGTTTEEAGTSVQDVQDFLKRSYSHKGVPVSVVQSSPAWEEE